MNRDYPKAEPLTIGGVVGENLARLRTGQRLTQCELARALHAQGVQWTRSKVAGLEAGKRATVDLGDVVLLARFFAVSVLEFLHGDGEVALSSSAVPWPRRLAQLVMVGPDVSLRGRSVSPDVQVAQVPVREEWRDPATSVRQGWEADHALATRLGIHPSLVIYAAQRLWGRTLTDERDRRAETLHPDTAYRGRQATRGHITRDLAAEVATELRRMQVG